MKSVSRKMVLRRLLIAVVVAGGLVALGIEGLSKSSAGQLDSQVCGV